MRRDWLLWLLLTALVGGGNAAWSAPDEWSKCMSAGQRALQRKDYAAADKWFSAAVQQLDTGGAESLGLMRSLSSLAYVYQRENKLVEALPLRKRALAVAEKIGGPDHPEVAEALNGLAELYQAQGNYAEAAPLYERAIAIRQTRFGPNHAAVASSLNSLAEAARAHADRASAEQYFNRALSISSKLGPVHPELARSLNGLADVYVEQGKYLDAEMLYKQVLSMETDFGKHHVEIIRARTGLSSVSAHTKPSSAGSVPDAPKAGVTQPASTLESSRHHWWSFRLPNRSRSR